MTDKTVNDLYGNIRSEYDDARANGYRLHAYFLREQELILSILGKHPETVIDIGCGSGLMALPLQEKAKLLLCLDYNEIACKSAKLNMLNVIQGNAYSMPLPDDVINNAYCCQFLNQQSQENMKLLINESHRTLVQGGSLILIWRNGDALIHKIAHTLFRIFDFLKGRESFPVVNHPISTVEHVAHTTGFKTVVKETTFPLLNWKSDKLDGFLAKLIGASFLLVLEK